jgi:hypothetical protein
VTEGAPLSSVPANPAASGPAGALPAHTPAYPAASRPASGPAGALPAHTPGAPAAAGPAVQPANPVFRGIAPYAKAQPDAVQQAEAALKALRQARDPEAQRRATDALERAVRRLRGQPAESGKPSGAPQRE